MTIPYLPSRWQITTPDLADDPDVFPYFPGRQLLVLKTPQFSSSVQKAVSGRRVASAFWSYPIWQFKVAHEVLRDRPSPAELRKFWGFFCSKLGQFRAWFFFDPSDHSVTACQFGTGDGSTTVFQLSRQVGQGTAYAYSEPVLGIAGTPTIYVNGTPTSAYTLGTSGQITFNSAPSNGAALSWTGEFLFLCMFGADQLDTEQLFIDLWDSKGIAFESIKL